MKKQFLFLIIVLLTFTSGRGQTSVYHPFPDSAAWRAEIYMMSCSGFCYCSTITMGGDTTIGIHNYKKMGYGAVRQDIPMKKVYFYEYASNL